MPRLAIIGGTGVYDPSILTDIKEESVTTEFGDVNVVIGNLADKEVVFMNRHGKGHALPPHKVNYKGNIMALKNLGVEKVLATAAVGSLNLSMEPGSLVLCNQFIDFTKNRSQTFYEDGVRGVLHVDMTEPYCRELRQLIKAAAEKTGVTVIDGGTYVCTEGPRFETPAEIRMFKHWGGDLVGMTGVPEVVLAREAGLCYQTVAVCTNYAAGIAPQPLTHAEVMEAMEQSSETLRSLIKNFIELNSLERNCQCKKAIEELGSLGK